MGGKVLELESERLKAEGKAIGRAEGEEIGQARGEQLYKGPLDFLAVFFLYRGCKKSCVFGK